MAGGIADLMEQMADAGAPMPAILIAVRAIEASENALAEKRATERDRKRRQREKDGTVTGQSRDADGTVTATPSPLTPPPNRPPDPLETPPPISPLPSAPPLPISDAVACWNEAAKARGWPCVATVSDTRRRSLSGRLRDHGLDGWCAAVTKARQSAYLGHDPPSWFTFNWIIKPENFLKLTEGNYDRRNSANSEPDPTLVALERYHQQLGVVG